MLSRGNLLPSNCQGIFRRRNLVFVCLYSALTSWEIDGETVETVSDFILEGSKITADGDCSHEIKRHLLLGRKVMTNLWRRQWHPTPVLLPGESQGQRSLVGCSVWGRTESDTTEVT